ncbi:DNA topoisomerase 3-alpha isoform X2 [Harpegnathos saltator]|uniref:DNA topoisomerase 3-alpha isoform X2 n=1 Tax=Harpegnathos saltator TaxID=610380 RepID=UPI00058C29EC|nr:DNA topoisomerase 3-alpha isoform X2 [Harpegnathos saltator]
MAFFKLYKLVSSVSCNLTVASNKYSFSNLYKSTKVPRTVRRYSSKDVMKVLSVAEKHDAAKNIAAFLSRGTSRKREGFEFTGSYRKWQGCHPLSLFDAPVFKQCSDESYIKIKKTLEREIRSCNALIIWTDCDREGENIGFEIIQVCQVIKPNIRIYRAKFSEITKQSIERALQTLGEPDKAMSDAVDVRSELDLRIGAAFTRFQTLRLQKVFPDTLSNMLISYGSCQFPTLGFVVERFLAIDRFKSEPYWKIKVIDEHDGIFVEFRWARVRLFEKMPCQIFLDMCLERPEATVEKVTCKPKSKWRPLPLDTIELEKQGSRKLRLNAKETMRIAERLYTQGLISYPRTETNIFPKELNLAALVEQQVNNQAWGNFARGLLESGIIPRQGKKSDQAHPPIHPTKYTDNLQGNEAKVYEFVVRHFLACVSKNAEGQETTVEIDIAGEKFTTNGLEVLAKNYLDVYIYEKWNDKEIHSYQPRQVFRPTSIDMVEEKTSPPNLLTEAELIALMDKHGIGTDATHAEHIDTIKSRQYVGLTDTQHFMPGKLGIGLVMGYDNMGFQMSKPNLRADLEKDLQLICQRQKDPNEVLQSQINKYREVFKIAIERANLIDDALARYLDERPIENGETLSRFVEDVSIFKCPRCGSNMILKNRKQGRGKYISCAGYPACTNVIWLSEAIEDVEVLSETCNQCTENIRKLKFKLVRNVVPLYGTSYTTCIGCDSTFNEMLNIKNDCIRQTGRSNHTIQNNTSSSASQSFATTIGSTQRHQSAPNSSFSNPRPGPSQTNNIGNSSVPRGRARNHNSKSNRLITANKNTTIPNNGGNADFWINDDWDNANSLENTSNWTASGSSHSTANRTTTWGNIDNNAVIMCNCHETAIQLTVRKEGPNIGRLFYKCAKPQGSGCHFFLWASDSDESQANTMSEPSSRLTSVNRNDRDATSTGHSSRVTFDSGWGSDASSNDVICQCNQPARKLTVHKEGPNKGRQFYGCPKGINSSCNFFQWADENTDQSSFSAMSGGSRGRSRGGSRDSHASKRPRLTGSKRKCGICGVEGHTRTTCPENVMD